MEYIYNWFQDEDITATKTNNINFTQYLEE